MKTQQQQQHLFPKSVLQQTIKRQKKPAYALTDAIPFGKYKHCTIAAIIVLDPAYIPYMQKKHRLQVTPQVEAFIIQQNYLAQ